MEVGLFLVLGETTPPDLIAETARAAEERGFHALWVPEHVVLFKDYESTYPYSRSGRIEGVGDGLLEPFTALTFIAAHTTRIRIGTCICLVPQRNPVYTAKQVADLDFLSGGRFDFGIGTGWQREEFEAVQVPWGERGRRTDDYLNVMKALWCDEISEYQGTHYSLPPSILSPKPIQKPHPRIFVGGEGDTALRRAATFGSGWMGAGVQPTAIGERIAALDEILAEHGRSADDFLIYAVPNRSPKLERFRGYEDAGVDQVVQAVPVQDADQIRTSLDTIAQMAMA